MSYKSAIYGCHDVDEEPPKLIAIIGDQETCVGFILGGIGQEIRSDFNVGAGGCSGIIDSHCYNYFVVERETRVDEIEKALETFTSRKDVNIIIINQKIAELIRPMIDSRQKAIPAILEIPSSDQPYDRMKDSIMKRAISLVKHNNF